jgi:HK97 family phage major capsid protein
MDNKEVLDLLDRQGKAWEEFKKTNDQRLAEIEKKGAADPLTAQKLDKVNAELTQITADFKAAQKRADELETKLNRPQLGNDVDGKGAERLDMFNRSLKSHARSLGRPVPADIDMDGLVAYRKAFETFTRKGKDELSDADRKTIAIGSDPDGGVMAPPEMEQAIDRVLSRLSAMRSMATIRPIGTASYKKVVVTSGASYGWAGETEAPSETTTPKFAELEFTPGKLWAEPHTTSDALEDISFNVENWLLDEVEIAFSEGEGDGYINGDAIKKPRGFLNYPKVANANYAWGSLGYIASGAASDFAASNPSDKLIDQVHACRRQYRQNAQWVMNDLTLGKIRKFKGSDNNYLWVPGLQQGQVGQLLGYPVMTDDFMPDVGTDTFPIGFGDWKRGYLIVDRRGVTVLRDPYTRKPYVKFYTTKRTTGGVQNFEAIKLMKIAAS